MDGLNAQQKGRCKRLDKWLRPPRWLSATGTREYQIPLSLKFSRVADDGKESRRPPNREEVVGRPQWDQLRNLNGGGGDA